MAFANVWMCVCVCVRALGGGLHLSGEELRVDAGMGGAGRGAGGVTDPVSGSGKPSTVSLWKVPEVVSRC